MNIVALVKQVPGTDNVKMNPETGTMVRTGKDNVINPLDENALTEALRIKQQTTGTTVTAVSMGPQTAEKALKEAIALGADEGILLSSRAFAGADTIATARVLAAAVKKLENVSMILCGERATDGETGQTGPMVAAMLGIPVVTFVKEINVGENTAIVIRIVENGYEKVEIPYPFMATVVKDINEPGFPTLSGKVQARETLVKVWGEEELGLPKNELGLTGSPTRVVKIFSPKLARDTRILKHDGSGSAVGILVKLLQEKEIV